MPLRVLVVDDNVDAADSLSLLMQQLGHEVRSRLRRAVGNCDGAVFVPHLVMLDIGMPLMNGYDVARAIVAMKLDPLPPSRR